MNPIGGADPLYTLARRVLLDALDALGAQREALILVGAQAVYIHTGPAGMAVAEHTTDADIALDPQFLTADPTLENAILAAHFRPVENNVGSWVTTRELNGRPVDVMLDLLVPEAVGGAGRRGARLGTHGNKAARKVKGLEAALVDKSERTISSLDVFDARSFLVAVAGPAALLVAKVHKISDRDGDLGRSNDKDALDALRILRTTGTKALADSLARLSAASVSGPVTREAIAMLGQLFEKPTSTGSQMAARAATPLEPADTTAASCAALTGDLLAALRS